MTDSQKDLAILKKLTDARQSFFNEVGKIVIGQQEILDHMLIALLARGHSLLVGVPGLAKTLLIKTLSEVLDLSFKRIQFMPVQVRLIQLNQDSMHAQQFDTYFDAR